MSAHLAIRTDPASPAAIDAARDLRDRAVTAYLNRNRAGGSDPVTLGETVIAGHLTCTIEAGPTTMGGTRTFRALWSLDGHPISRCDAERALMGRLP